MVNNFFGWNTLRIDDKAAYLAHIRKLRPKALLFYADQLDFARQIKAEFPDMVVIIRNWPDDNLYVKQSPQSWLSQHEGQASGGLYLYTCNESGLTADNIQWHMQLMDLCIQKNVHLVMLNPATGTWDTPDFERLKPLLIKASQHRELFVIGLHSYAGGVITSGIAGGLPINAGIATSVNDAPGSKGHNFIPHDKWPTRDEIIQNNWTTFHLGRHSWIIRYCRDILKLAELPRFALTETGFDYLGDVGQWLNSLDHSGFTSVNGWQTLRSQWVSWWGGSADGWYIEQFKYAALALMEGLEFALFFCYGDDGNWHNYDVSKSGIPALLEQATGTPPVTPLPFDYGDMPLCLLEITNSKITSIYLRAMPSTDNSPLSQIPDGAKVNYSQNALNSGVYKWHKAIYQGVTGFIAETGNYEVTRVFESEPPPVETKHTVTIKIKGLTAEQASEVLHNVEISIE